MNAVLEHIPKWGVLSRLSSTTDEQGAAGIASIDVPNADWLSAGHERYMEIPHEVGLMAESLTQALEMAFAHVEELPADNDLRPGAGLRPTLSGLRTMSARTFLGTLVRWPNPEDGGNSISALGLIAVAKA